MTLAPTSEEPGFIRVDCPSCGNDEQWLKCDECGESDHFSLAPDGFSCACGASYGHARCSCGESVPPRHLSAVPYDKGPLSLASLEVAWGRVALLGIALIAVVGGILYAVL